MNEIILEPIESDVTGYGPEYYRRNRQPTEPYYVENLNFWTVRIQPRDVSLRITVYGKPNSFTNRDSTIELKPDMASYSSFKIHTQKQVSGAVSIIRQAYDKKNLGKPN